MIVIDYDPKIKISRDYKGTDELLLAFAKKLKEIDAHFFRYPTMRLKWADKYLNIDPVTKKKEPKSMAAIGFEAQVKIGGSDRVVIYAETSRTKDGETTYSPRNEIFDGTKIFTQNETEKLAFYLLCSSHLKQGMIVVEDIENDAVKIAEKRKQSADLEFFIYSDASPMSEERLKVIAYNFGIDVEKFKTPELLKNVLHDRILTEEGRKPGTAIVEFKKQVMNLTDEVKAISIVSQGVYKKVIKFNHPDSQWEWTNTPDVPILKVPVNDRGDEMLLRKRLASFLLASEKLYLLKEALGVSDEEDVESTSVDLVFDKYTDWTKLKWNILKKALKAKGIKFELSDKMPRLIELCEQAYKDVEPS